MDLKYGITELPSPEQLERLLSKVKVNLFYEKGAAFLSSLMGNMEFRWDETIPTAATNGLVIKWNPYFFMKIPLKTRVFVLAHEIWHVAYLHNIRRGNRNPMIYNIAADHIINTKLISDGYELEGLPFDIFQDFKYHEWSVDRVYEDIMDSIPPMESITISFGLADDVEDAEEGQDKDKGDDGNGDGADDGSGNGPKDTGSAGSHITAQIIGNIVQAIQTSKLAGEAGVIPGELEQMVDDVLSPILPWEMLLQQFMTELCQEDYSYRRPNRRYDDPILPSLTSEGSLQELNWYIDVSGSVTDEMIKRFFSEMVYVKYTYTPEKINIITFDYEIQNEITLEEDDDFHKLEFTGRGGTWLEPVREHILRTKPNAAIIFSDLECDPMEKVDIPVLWAVFCEYGVYSKYAHRPDYGTIIEVIEDTK